MAAAIFAMLIAVAAFVLSDVRDENRRDPRAYSGTTVDLDDALEGAGLALPTSVVIRRFGAFGFTDFSYYFDLSLHCDAVGRALRDSRFSGVLGQVGDVPDAVMSGVRQVGWELPATEDSTWLADDHLDGVFRSAVVARASGDLCRMLVAAHQR